MFTKGNYSNFEKDSSLHETMHILPYIRTLVIFVSSLNSILSLNMSYLSKFIVKEIKVLWKFLPNKKEGRCLSVPHNLLYTMIEGIS